MGKVNGSIRVRRVIDFQEEREAIEREIGSKVRRIAQVLVGQGVQLDFHGVRVADHLLQLEDLVRQRLELLGLFGTGFLLHLGAQLSIL